MAKRQQIIAPHLNLPAKTKRRKAPRRSRAQSFGVGVRELAFLIVALDLGNMAFWYLAPWPVYRIVAFVVIFILWSNAASETARIKTKQAWDILNTMSTQAVHTVEHPRKQAMVAVRPELNQDTTAYLEAIKKDHYATIQTQRLYDTVPYDHRHRRVLHHPETTPTR